MNLKSINGFTDLMRNLIKKGVANLIDMDELTFPNKFFSYAPKTKNG